MNPDDLFVGGRCSACSRPRGPRNTVAARVMFTSARDVLHGARFTMDGEFYSGRSDWQILQLYLFSGPFLERLDPHERDLGEWRQASVEGRQKWPMWELITSTRHAPLLSRQPGSSPAPECAACGRAESHYRPTCVDLARDRDVAAALEAVPPLERPGLFLEAAALSAKHPAAALSVGNWYGSQFGLALPMERWQQLRRRRAPVVTSGLQATPIAVVPPEVVVPLQVPPAAMQVS